MAVIKLIDSYTNEQVEYFPVAAWIDGTPMTDANCDGVVYRKKGSIYYKRSFSGNIYPEWFGAKGDNITDDTVAIQNAINFAVSSGHELVFKQKNYLISDTLTIPAPINSANNYKALHMSGEGTGIYGALCFNNTVAGKVFLNFGRNGSYCIIKNLRFLDVNSYTSTCFYFISSQDSPAIANLWKCKFENIRIDNFDLGASINGHATDIVQDSYCSEFLWINGKANNNRTAFLFNNIQSVNHSFINFDIENSAPEDQTQLFKGFHFLRGTFTNHIGGSFIGSGPYVYIEMLNAGYFQATAGFNSINIRVEKKLTLNPLIHHAETSVINLSNAFFVNITNMSIYSNVSGGDNLFAKLGGQVAINCENVKTSSIMYVYGAITSNLIATKNSGYFKAANTYNIVYKRYIPTGIEYGSAGITGQNVDIPAIIEGQTIGSANYIVDANGYYVCQSVMQSNVGKELGTDSIRALVFKNKNASGIWSSSNPSTSYIKMPSGSSPFKIGFLKGSLNYNSSCIITISANINGTIVQIGSVDLTGIAGYTETFLECPNAISELFVDDVNWNGYINITRTGTINGYIGKIIIYYI